MIETLKQAPGDVLRARGIDVAPRAESKLLGGLAATAVVTLFLWLIYNRYLPIMEGWFSYYAELMHNGKLPYRDFYFFTQPFSLLEAWALRSLSDKIIYMRYCGFAERVGLTASLYFLVSRRFSSGASFWATVVSVLVFLTYPTDAFFTYLVTCCLFLVIGLIFLHAALAREQIARGVHLFLAGLMASLAFCTKQSNGAVVTVAMFFLAITLSPSWRVSVRQAAWFIAGWAVPVLIMFGWLHHYGLTQLYIRDVYQAASAAKGGPLAILFGQFPRTVTALTAGAAVVLIAYLWHVNRHKTIWFESRPLESDTRPFQAAGFAAIGFGLVGFAYLFPVELVGSFVIRTISLVLIRLLYWASLIAALRCAWRLLQRRSAEDPLVAIMLVGGFSWAYSSGLSFAIEQQAVLLLSCLALAYSYDKMQFKNGNARRAVIVVSAFFLLCACWQKYGLLYQWTGWKEGISKNTAISHWPRLAGYRTDASLMGTIDTIMDDVATLSKPGDAVFTFPHMPLINYVVGRPQPTFAPVDYWDVCPDWVAEADAIRVREARPKVIVELVLPESMWKFHEKAFRGGQRSGQRAIKRAIDDLANSGDYRLVRIVRTKYYGSFTDFIWVWARVN